MLDLDSIPEMFESLEGCLRQGNGGFRTERRMSDPHKDADQWLRASLDERNVLAPVYAERLRLQVRQLGQDVLDRVTRRMDGISSWRKANPHRVQLIQNRYNRKRTGTAEYRLKRRVWDKAYRERRKYVITE